MMPSRRWWFHSSLVIALFLCGVATEGAIAGEKVLRVGTPWSPKTIDPHIEGYHTLRIGIVETLANVDDTLQLQPGLARAWKVSDDKLTWTFELRPGVRFHDGSPLTAQTVKDSLERVVRKGAALARVPMENVVAVDEGRLQIRTREPFASLPAYLALGDTAPLARSSFDEKGEVKAPVGTGPFKFESWQVKDRITAARNPDYWGKEKSRVDRVVQTSVPNAVTRVAMLRGGELDIAQILPAEVLEDLRADARFRVFTLPIARCRFLAFNLTREPFSDQRVRQAVNLAINRAHLVKYVLDGMGEVSAGLFPPFAHWANQRLTPPPVDLQRARQLLAEAGWREADSKGILTRNGKPLVVTLLTYPERAELPPMAEVIQSQLREIGMQVDIRVLQYDASYEQRNAGQFDMYLVGRGLLFVPDPDDNLMQDYHSSSTSGKGFGAFRYQNTILDRLLAEGRSTFDPAARKRIYDDVQRILVDEVPVTYLNYYVNADVARSSVRNYRMHPIERSFRLELVEME